jgi:hypothetical protein
LFDAAGKQFEIQPAPFKNFEQARNEALRCARLVLSGTTFCSLTPT